MSNDWGRLMTTRADVLVIGGGIVGVSSAYYLARDGLNVHLVEQGDIAAGSSYGNAGLVTLAHSTPLPSPAALRKGLRWMLDPSSPLYIKPRPEPGLLSWLWRFRASCSEEAFRRAVPALGALSRLSLDRYQQLVDEEGIDVTFERRGLLLIYLTEEGFEEDQQFAASMREFGLASDVLSGDEVRARVPQARADVVGGVYYHDDAHIDPAGFTRALAARAQARGATLHTRTEVLGLEVSGERVARVRTTRGDFVADTVVLAAGAWSPLLARDVGLRLPIQAAKGYSITVRRPENFPEVPVILEEAKVAVTPMGDWLRFAGTLELAGLDMRINPVRVEAIKQGVRRYLDVDPDAEPLVELWRGLRPCTPDGYPIIGRAPRVSNLIIAAGHCMLGMTQGPGTGKLVADLVAGREPAIDMAPFAITRFNL